MQRLAIERTGSDWPAPSHAGPGTGESRAIGQPLRVMTYSAPASTSRMQRAKRSVASRRLIVLLTFDLRVLRENVVNPRAALVNLMASPASTAATIRGSG